MERWKSGGLEFPGVPWGGEPRKRPGEVAASRHPALTNWAHQRQNLRPVWLAEVVASALLALAG
jgi:hypothetical protein